MAWAFNPFQPLAWQPPLAEGQYVRIYGSLVSDEPHIAQNWGNSHAPGDFNTTVFTAWSGGRNNWDRDNPARPTEVHLPDLIAVLPDKVQRERIFGIAASTYYPAAWFSNPTETVDATFSPPGPRPPNGKLIVSELVYAASLMNSVTEGNNAKTGARITCKDDGAVVHVKVQQQWFTSGRFGALYRVRWGRKDETSLCP